MLGWLKRKAAPVPSEQLLESEGQTPLTEERLERLLGRLGPDSRTPSAPAAVVLKIDPLPSTDRMAASEPVAEALNEVDAPPTADSRTAEAPAVEGLNAVDAPPRTDSGADARFTLRREDLTITRRGQGPSAAELLAKGYTFATGPDGKMVVFDAEGNLTDTALSRPSPDSNAASEPAAAEAVQESDPLPSADISAAREPAAEALQETNALPSADSSAPAAEAAQESEPLPLADSSEPAAEALQESEPLPQTERKRAKKPAPKPLNEIESLPRTGGKPPKERVGGFTGMYVIAVASQKGGSGKTTIAAHLAVRAAAAGNGPVVLIDTDPQGSLAEWWQARAEDTPQLATVKPEALAANLAELRSYGTAIAIIDTPPALTGSIEQVIAQADLILIPVRPSPHDLRAAGGTVELAKKAGKPFLFVVNSASPRASITAQAVAALSEHGRVAPVILYQRTEYAASMIDGRTVTETATSGRSAQEIAELWQSVYAQIGLRVAA
jgi:chromosome partitioning protein